MIIFYYILFTKKENITNLEERKKELSIKNYATVNFK